MRYGLTLKTKAVDLSTSTLVAVLNEADARELGARALDRIEIADPQSGHKATAAVDITAGAVGPGEIGLFKELRQELHTTTQTKVEVKLVSELASVRHIRQKIRGATLSGEQI